VAPGRPHSDGVATKLTEPVRWRLRLNPAHLYASGQTREGGSEHTAVAGNCEFVEPIQSDLPCPVPFAKIFPFRPDPNQMHIQTVSTHRGAFRDRHGRWERDAVDARASGAQWQSQGEMNLVSGQLACKMIGALADGKAVWSWHPLLVSSQRRHVGPTGSDKPLIPDDGDKTNSLTGESTK